MHTGSAEMMVLVPTSFPFLLLPFLSTKRNSERPFEALHRANPFFPVFPGIMKCRNALPTGDKGLPTALPPRRPPSPALRLTGVRLVAFVAVLLAALLQLWTIVVFPLWQRRLWEPLDDALRPLRCHWVTDSRIPRKIIVVWKGPVLSGKALKFHHEWVLYEPCFERLVVTDADCAVLAHRANLSEVYHSYPLNVMRADACRVLAVYFHGGMYLDIDVQRRVPLRQWWNVTSDVMLGWEFQYHPTITNWFFAAVPGHACFGHAIDLMRSRALALNRTPQHLLHNLEFVHDLTGPWMISDAILDCPGIKLATSSMLEGTAPPAHDAEHPPTSYVPTTMDPSVLPVMTSHGSEKQLSSRPAGMSRSLFVQFTEEDVTRRLLVHHFGSMYWDKERTATGKQYKSWKALKMLLFRNVVTTSGSLEGFSYMMASRDDHARMLIAATAGGVHAATTSSEFATVSALAKSDVKSGHHHDGGAAVLEHRNTTVASSAASSVISVLGCCHRNASRARECVSALYRNRSATIGMAATDAVVDDRDRRSDAAAALSLCHMSRDVDDRLRRRRPEAVGGDGAPLVPPDLSPPVAVAGYLTVAVALAKPPKRRKLYSIGSDASMALFDWKLHTTILSRANTVLRIAVLDCLLAAPRAYRGRANDTTSGAIAKPQPQHDADDGQPVVPTDNEASSTLTTTPSLPALPLLRSELRCVRIVWPTNGYGVDRRLANHFRVALLDAEGHSLGKVITTYAYPSAFHTMTFPWPTVPEPRFGQTGTSRNSGDDDSEPPSSGRRFFGVGGDGGDLPAPVVRFIEIEKLNCTKRHHDEVFANGRMPCVPLIFYVSEVLLFRDEACTQPWKVDTVLEPSLEMMSFIVANQSKVRKPRRHRFHPYRNGGAVKVNGSPQQDDDDVARTAITTSSSSSASTAADHASSLSPHLLPRMALPGAKSLNVDLAVRFFSDDEDDYDGTDGENNQRRRRMDDAEEVQAIYRPSPGDNRRDVQNGDNVLAAPRKGGGGESHAVLDLSAIIRRARRVARRSANHRP